MTLPGRRQACLGAILLLLASRGAAQKPEDLTAVLMQIEGPVTLRNVRPAAQRQVIRQGEVVHVPAGAQVTLVCSTERLESLKGPQDWVLDAVSCGRGRVLPDSSYRNLAGYAGRMIPRKGNLLLEIEPRGVEVRPALLLSPRNTAVMDAAPHFVWTRAPGAVEYEIKIRGPVEMTLHVAISDLHCGPGSAPWKDFDVCVWTPSDKWPRLEPEKPVFLQLGSPKAMATPIGETSEIHLLSMDDQVRMKERLRQIAALSMDEESRLLLTAGAYTQGGLYADAIGAYDEALQEQEMPEARVALGDLYLRIGLIASAEQEYRHVLAGAPDAATRAAADLGLGYASYSHKLFDEARAHFEHAAALYSTLCLPAEEEEARVAAAAAVVQAPSENDSH